MTAPFDRYRRWRGRGACRTAPDPEVFFGPPGDPGTEAREICASCPVLEECRRDTLGEPYGIWAGLSETQRDRRRRQLRDKAAKWPADFRRAWGEALHALRAEDMAWNDIRLLTGMPQPLGQDLVAEYVSSLAAPVPLAPAPAPRPWLTGPDKEFPARAGRRHLWVQFESRNRDSWYRGETPDGVWINAQFHLGRGESHLWVPRTRTRFHGTPPTPIYLEYIGRPDRGGKEKAVA